MTRYKCLKCGAIVAVENADEPPVCKGNIFISKEDISIHADIEMTPI